MSFMKAFLEQPKDSCRTIISVGKPGTGKTYNMLKCLEKFWLPRNYFSELHLVLPVFKYEQKSSYKFLEDYKGSTKIFIYNGYHPNIGKKLLAQQKKEGAKPIFFGLDDTTHMKKSLFHCNNMTEIATTSRHLQIHTWIIVHWGKGVIPPAVKNQTAFIFVLQCSRKALEDIYETFFTVGQKDYPRLKNFIEMMQEVFDESDHGTLLIDDYHKGYTTNSNTWWD